MGRVCYFENQKEDVEKNIPKDKFKVAFNEGMEVCVNSGCRIGERAQDVENGADADFPARANGVLHRPVQFGRKEEADADLRYTGGHPVGRQLQIHAQGLQNIGRAAARRYRPVAVFGHPDARGSHHETGAGGHVETARAVAARAHDVHQHTVFCVHAGVHEGGPLPHGPGGPHNFVNGFALHAERREEGADLGGAGVAAHDLAKDGAHF